MESKNKLLMVFMGLGLYFISAGLSYVVFSYGSKSSESAVSSLKPTPAGQSKFKIDVSAPKTEICPINGMMYTKAEKDIWSVRRPVAAMIENSTDARPQSGLSRADVVYEAVAEGGITRFMGIFYCGAAALDVQIAPVRSVRVYYINWASEYADRPILVHVGGANDFGGTGDTASQVKALELLQTIKWRTPKGNDFDTTYDSGYPLFWRNESRLDHPVATEHTMMASLDQVYKQADKRGLAAVDSKGLSWDKGLVQWKFISDKPSSAPTASNISFKFWDNQPGYTVEWKYDASTNSYLRFNGGVEHMDLESKTQLSAKNVVIMYTKEVGPVDRNKHMYYEALGTGKAQVFQNGEVIEGTWKKENRTARTKFLDKKGSQISLVGGQTWIEVLSATAQVDYR